MPTDQTLTITDAGYLCDLIRGVDADKKLDWYPIGAEGDAPHADYVLRAFTNEDGSFYSHTADIRDAFVWCSGITEQFLKVRDVMTAMRNAIDAHNGMGNPMAFIRE